MNTLRPDSDLVAEVRALNSAGVEIPWMWHLTEEAFDGRSKTQEILTFGINNSVGILRWNDHSGRYVPALGKNTEWLSYYLAGFHESGVPPYAEVPVEIVYSTLTEFLDTRMKPTRVEWREAASPMSQSL
ncbi:Imm1 family immunity protein [Actinokineospora sp. NBRC 105648]|uniref:Imm1 family immunity protein n=1 Tax=Actinokineospora sp. NBRC 105648 TaxID=3032206 RepID=UPI00255544F5|nr:Imm1 family immunity protein [Actinokineospora sp. NBRC 105648]